jgi:anti-sigma-K factor RskA
MSRVRYGSRAVNNRLSRRRVLAIAATAGIGASVAGVAGLSLAGETPTAAQQDTAPLVISLRDAKEGTFDVFSGSSKSTLTDKKLAARLLKAVHR